jgi:hypothetical protein
VSYQCNAASEVYGGIRWLSLCLYMGMKRLIGYMTLALLVAVPFAVAQTAGQDAKKAGSEVKEAAKDTGSAVKKTTKKAAKRVKRTTKKAVNKSAEATEKTAAKVKDKTERK